MNAHVPLSTNVRVAREIVEQIRACGIEPDDPDFGSLIEAECDVLDRIRRILRAARLTEANSKALGGLIQEMRDRRSRLDNKADSLRRAAAWAMQELGLSKVEGPDLSASLTVGQPPVVIDETALPDEYFRVKREINKDAVRIALGLGKDVPGARLGNPAPVLTVRTR